MVVNFPIEFDWTYYSGTIEYRLEIFNEIRNPILISSSYVRRFTDMVSDWRDETLFLYCSDSQDGLYIISARNRISTSAR